MQHSTVMFKNINLLTGLGLTLLLSSLLASPVKANLTLEPKSESLAPTNTHEQNHLITQLFGHDLYDGEPKIEWNGYILGRVVGYVGHIVTVLLPDGTYFNAAAPEGGVLQTSYDRVGHPNGYNVLVKEVDDGVYEIEMVAHPLWISTLESEYGWRRVDRLPPLSERTAYIWAQLGGRRGSTTFPAPTRRYTPSYTPAEESEPIRGLW